MNGVFLLAFSNSPRAAAVVLEIRSEATYGAPRGIRDHTRRLSVRAASQVKE